MLVDGYKGQKVQDVKKLIQKMMVDNVCHRMHAASPKSSILSFFTVTVSEETSLLFCSPLSGA